MTGNDLSKREEGEIEKIAKELQVELPKGNLPLLMKLMALFTLIGGLSIVGSIFADIVSPRTGFGQYILRLSIGLAAIAVAYGLLRKKRWSIWLYGLIVFIGLILNAPFAILPAIITVYLYLERDWFEPSIFDKTVSILIEWTKEFIKRKKSGLA